MAKSGTKKGPPSLSQRDLLDPSSDDDVMPPPPPTADGAPPKKGPRPRDAEVAAQLQSASAAGAKRVASKPSRALKPPPPQMRSVGAPDGIDSQEEARAMAEMGGAPPPLTEAASVKKKSLSKPLKLSASNRAALLGDDAPPPPSTAWGDEPPPPSSSPITRAKGSKALKASAAAGAPDLESADEELPTPFVDDEKWWENTKGRSQALQDLAKVITGGMKDSSAAANRMTVLKIAMAKNASKDLARVINDSASLAEGNDSAKDSLKSSMKLLSKDKKYTEWLRTEEGQLASEGLKALEAKAKEKAKEVKRTTLTEHEEGYLNSIKKEIQSIISGEIGEFSKVSQSHLRGSKALCEATCDHMMTVLEAPRDPMGKEGGIITRLKRRASDDGYDITELTGKGNEFLEEYINTARATEFLSSISYNAHGLAQRQAQMSSLNRGNEVIHAMAHLIENEPLYKVVVKREREGGDVVVNDFPTKGFVYFAIEDALKKRKEQEELVEALENPERRNLFDQDKLEALEDFLCGKAPKLIDPALFHKFKDYKVKHKADLVDGYTGAEFIVQKKDAKKGKLTLNMNALKDLKPQDITKIKNLRKAYREAQNPAAHKGSHQASISHASVSPSAEANERRSSISGSSASFSSMAGSFSSSVTDSIDNSPKTLGKMGHWKQYVDEKGKLYYQNNVTKETTQDAPVTVRVGEDPASLSESFSSRKSVSSRGSVQPDPVGPPPDSIWEMKPVSNAEPSSTRSQSHHPAKGLQKALSYPPPPPPKEGAKKDGSQAKPGLQRQGAIRGFERS